VGDRLVIIQMSIQTYGTRQGSMISTCNSESLDELPPRSSLCFVVSLRVVNWTNWIHSGSYNLPLFLDEPSLVFVGYEHWEPSRPPFFTWSCNRRVDVDPNSKHALSLPSYFDRRRYHRLDNPVLKFKRVVSNRLTTRPERPANNPPDQIVSWVSRAQKGESRVARSRESAFISRRQALQRRRGQIRNGIKRAKLAGPLVAPNGFQRPAMPPCRNQNRQPP